MATLLECKAPLSKGGYRQLQMGQWAPVDPEFGNGIRAEVFSSSGPSEFTIYVDWASLEQAIETFAAAGELRAINLMEARRVAHAAKDFVSDVKSLARGATL